MQRSSPGRRPRSNPCASYGDPWPRQGCWASWSRGGTTTCQSRCARGGHSQRWQLVLARRPSRPACSLGDACLVSTPRYDSAAARRCPTAESEIYTRLQAGGELAATLPPLCRHFAGPSALSYSRSLLAHRRCRHLPPASGPALRRRRQGARCVRGCSRAVPRIGTNHHARKCSSGGWGGWTRPLTLPATHAPPAAAAQLPSR